VAPHQLMTDARELVHILNARAEVVAQVLLGEPNRKASSRHELRFGSHGSVGIVITGDKRGLWFDHELLEGGDLLELIRREHRCSFPEAVAIAESLVGATAPPAKSNGHARVNGSSVPDDAERTRRALQLWHQAGPIIAGSLASIYLVTRRCVVVETLPDLHSVLRWHPSCPWESGQHGCMVALWTDVRTGAPRGIHRTAIGADGAKIGRKALGPKAGCVIRLWPDDSVTTAIVIGEGIESVAGAATRIRHHGALLQPAWSCGDAGNLRSFPVLPGIEVLTILVDHDGAGQAAAAECSARWTKAERKVVRLTPDIGGEDFNDLIT
jgi:putative DNA primase/helicase